MRSDGVRRRNSERRKIKKSEGEGQRYKEMTTHNKNKINYVKNKTQWNYVANTNTRTM